MTMKRELELVTQNGTKRHSIIHVPCLETITERGDNNKLFEIILGDVGGFGRYQVFLLLLASVSSIVCACNHLSPIYLAFTPKFECISSSVILDGSPSELPTSALDARNSSSAFASNSECMTPNNEACTSFQYDHSVMVRSVVTEFDLVCSRLPLLPTISSTYMAGVVLTISISGFLSDRFGRRTIVLALSAIHILASFLTCFSSSSYLMFIVARFFVGGTIHGVWLSLFVITTEISIHSRRGVTGFVMNLGWNVGAIVLSAVAYVSRDWVSMQLSFAGLSLITLAYFFVVPESPRWLVRQGRFDEAELVLRKIAKFNGVNLDMGHASSRFENNLKTLKLSANMEESQDKLGNETVDEVGKGCSHIFANAEFRKRIGLFAIPWFFVGMSAYGIHFSVKLVEFDIFIISIVKEIAIIVCIVSLLPIYSKFKRTLVLPTFFFLGGLMGVLFLAVPVDFTLARVGLLVVAQGLIVADFCLLDTYTPEAFSTDTRNFVLAILDGTSKIGTLIAPFVVDLGGDWNSSVPPAIFGSLMILGSLVIKFLLPETKGIPLKQSVSDLTK